MPAPTTSPTSPGRVEALALETPVAQALEWLEEHADWVTELQIRLTEIPAPPFQEARRAAAVREVLASAGWPAVIDAAGSVVAEAGARGRGVALVSAHLDTAFAPDGPVRVRREGARLLAPGITDNGAGLAAMLAVAAAFRAARCRTRLGVAFAANVGEEGEGNLRGMRALAERYGRRLASVIVVDGARLDRVTTKAIASRRFEVIAAGPGGHSWADGGAPNPIHALGRMIARIAALPVPRQPRTTLNVGLIEGGNAINAIPQRAAMKVDLRSESESALERLEKGLRRAVELGALAERESARQGADRLAIEFRALGSRPGGELAPQAPLLAAIHDVDRYLGITATVDSASTDANIPLSLGVPAITIGGGGAGAGAHSASEWYDARGRVAGLNRILLTLLVVAGSVTGR
ncbi:MAG TPA: M20/M25/M40 family metallo-hydrolase [Candidatus Acidoferrales bacterium]|nr:M20/M25/M40 family metallo-hydrolase [Candidatus Acidoferrales bacterium]